MDSERKHPWQERLDNPLKQPEVESVRLTANWNFGVEVAIPDYTTDLMMKLQTLAEDLVVLVTAIDPDDAKKSLEAVERLYGHAGLFPDPTIDAVAPRPAPGDYSAEGYAARKKRRWYLLRGMRLQVVSKAARRREHIPDWIPQDHSHDGWMLAVYRLVKVVQELEVLSEEVKAFGEDVKARAPILKPGCARPDVKLPAKRRGGPKPAADRTFALGIAVQLTNPEEMDPPGDFEPWTPTELAALFAALGFKQLGEIKATKNLLRQLKSDKEVMRKYRQRSFVFPHIPRRSQED